MTKFFHVTPHADAILRNGFEDHTVRYSEADEVSGVHVSDEPVGIEEASGELLVITFPDDLNLDDYAVHEEGAPAGWRREWAIPADLINAVAKVERDPSWPWS